MRRKPLALFEIALVLVRLDHVASRIVNANHSIMRAAAVKRVSDCVVDGVRFGIPQATEWERISEQINAASIFSQSDFVGVHAHKQVWSPSKGIERRSYIGENSGGVMV